MEESDNRHSDLREYYLIRQPKPKYPIHLFTTPVPPASYNMSRLWGALDEDFLGEPKLIPIPSLSSTEHCTFKTDRFRPIKQEHSYVGALFNEAFYKRANVKFISRVHSLANVDESDERFLFSGKVDDFSRFVFWKMDDGKIVLMFWSNWDLKAKGPQVQDLRYIRKIQPHSWDLLYIVDGHPYPHLGTLYCRERIPSIIWSELQFRTFRCTCFDNARCFPENIEPYGLNVIGMEVFTHVLCRCTECGFITCFSTRDRDEGGLCQENATRYD